jgi:hypothetical protein
MPAQRRPRSHSEAMADTHFRVAHTCRARIRSAAAAHRLRQVPKVVRGAPVLTLLGAASWDDVVRHISALMQPGMTWENHGTVWHIDHRVPCCVFDLDNPLEQRMCFHIDNIQPMWAKQNSGKGGRADPTEAQRYREAWLARYGSGNNTTSLNAAGRDLGSAQMLATQSPEPSGNLSREPENVRGV